MDAVHLVDEVGAVGRRGAAAAHPAVRAMSSCGQAVSFTYSND